MIGTPTGRMRWLRAGLKATWVALPVLGFVAAFYLFSTGATVGARLLEWVQTVVLPHKWLAVALWTAPFVAAYHAVSRRAIGLWRHAAADLGLDVPPVQGRLPWAMLALWPTSKQVYDFLPPMQGDLRGVTVSVAADTAFDEVREGSRIRKVETVVTASTTRGPDVNLEVTETGIVSLDDLRDRVGLPPADACETGDAAFDDRFDVRLWTPAEVDPEWVLTPGVRDALLAVDHLTELTVADSQVTLRLDARTFDPATLERLTSAVTELATAIERIAERHP